MTNWQGVYPSAGAVVGSRPTITVTAYVDETDIELYYAYTITKGGTSYSDGEGVFLEFQGSAGAESMLFYLPEDLEDGTWSIVSSIQYGLTSAGAHISGSPSASSTFTVASVPTTILVSPAPDYWTAWSGTDHLLPLYWQFSSTSPLAYQTAYQVIVRRFDNQTVVYDSGKVASSAQNAVATIPAAQKDVQLEWSVRTWNNTDTPTVYPAYRKVGAGTPPVSSISSPTENQVINGALVDLTTSATTSGGRTVARIEASLWQGSVRLWSKTQTGSWTSGQSVQITDSAYVIPQSTQSYQYRVTHTDSIGLRSTQVVRNFTVTYTPPAIATAPTVTAAYYDDFGYVRIRWGSEALDSAFYSWVVERRGIQLDPNTLTPTGEWSDWTEAGRVYNLAISYEFRDYLAPAGHYIEYRVKQVAIRYGQEMVGEPSGVAAVNAISTSYWLMAGTSTGTMTKVTNWITNPSFETNTTGWVSTGAGSTISRVTTEFSTGVASLRVVVTGSATQQGVYYSPVVQSKLVAGSKFGVYVRVKGTAGLPLEIYAISQGSGNVDRIQNVTLTGGWDTFTVGDATLGATLNPYVIVRTRAAQAGTFYVDSAMLFDSIEVPSYFDGSIPGATWDGTANASTSSTYVFDDASVEANLVPIRLYNVTGDQFTDEIMQNEFNLIGRGRYVEKGDRLGVRGTLDCQLRDGQGYTARQKRLLLENFKENYSKAAMRNPFGDVYTVSIGDVTVTRIPGTGLSEFTDVSIPYTEVVE